MIPDIHTLTGAYALDALDPHERADFERHLAKCADCAAEVAGFRATAARLGTAVAVSPPERLRTWIRDGIARTRQEPPSGLRLVNSVRAQDPATRRTWLLPATAVAAGVALLAAGIFAGIAVHAGDQTRSAQERLVTAQQQNMPLSELLAAPDVGIASSSGAAGSVTLLDSRMLQRGLLVAQNMPAQPSGKTYQAWDISPTGFQSLGLLGNGGSGNLAVPDLDGSDDIGITIEPVGGSRQPTSSLLMDFAVAG